MAKSFSLQAGAVHLGMPTDSPPVPESDTPFRMLVLGDFRGQASAARRPVLIDRDNFDEVLRRLGVSIQLPPSEAGQQPIALTFAEMEDFHPDRLFQRIEAFEKLRDLREQLGNPRTFARAAAELSRWAVAGPLTQPPAPQPAAPSESSSQSLLEQILGTTLTPAPAPPPSAAGPTLNWKQFLHGLAAPHLSPNVEKEQAELIAVVDAAITALMRSVLHHPDFQAAESAWRAVEMLVRRLDTDSGLKLYVLDLGNDQLATDLAGDDLTSSALFKLLVENAVQTPGASPWSVVIGNYTFDRTRADADLLGRLGAVARQAGAPFLAAAHPHVVGCASFAQQPDPADWRDTAAAEDEAAWQALQQLPDAAYLGLAAPRFLLRAPYGRETVPTETFAFEELPAGANHEDYLWGNPAFVCGLLLGQAFNLHGWDARPGQVTELDGLPLHVYREDGEASVKPCAEILLTDRAIEAILERSVMPLASVLNRDVIHLVRSQSLARPATTLAGRWR